MHACPLVADVTSDWTAGVSQSARDEPDHRRFLHLALPGATPPRNEEIPSRRGPVGPSQGGRSGEFRCRSPSSMDMDIQLSRPTVAEKKRKRKGLVHSR